MISNREIAARLEAIVADITTLKLDAIVNAANEPLIPGGGVDGAIRRAAGIEMDEDLARLGRCTPGTSVITDGYRLPALHVIHTVAPIYSSSGEEEERIFANCYASALKLADENDIGTIAFPAIGTGAYRWPPKRASELAFAAVLRRLRDGGAQTRIVFCSFAADDHRRYTQLLTALT
jgi:O-acetyl-ADP-ribose deacetylase (regulator of RNase III)